jgi:hypothetical protein
MHRISSTPLHRALLVAAVALLPRALGAQMPGLPVLQSAFPNRGVTAGVNYGSSSGERAYGAAAAFATSGSRLAASLGLGVLDPSDAGVPSRSSAGLRIAVTGPRFLDRTVGVAAFAGFGGSPRKKTQPGVTNIPAGVSVAWRHAIGESRGIAVYAAPFYSWTRSSLDGKSASQGLFRVSAGLDVAVAQRIGVTVGTETGSKAGAGEPGPTSSSFGVGLAYAFR